MLKPDCNNCTKGYFLIYSPQYSICGKCSFKCLECDTSQDQCLSCSDTQSRDLALNCECRMGFYQPSPQTSEDPKVCLKCKSKCKHCQQTSDNCLECQGANRLSNSPDCQCQSGFYEVVALDLKDCSKCQEICKTCEYSDYNCTSCNGRYRQGPDCSCRPETYSLAGSTDCVVACPSNTYQD